MNISYSELILLNNSVIDNVNRLVDAGSDRIELMMDGAAWDSYNNNYGTLIRELREKDVHYSVHPAAWDINLTAEMKAFRDTAYEHHIHAMRFAAEIGASKLCFILVL